MMRRVGKRTNVRNVYTVSGFLPATRSNDNTLHSPRLRPLRHPVHPAQARRHPPRPAWYRQDHVRAPTASGCAPLGRPGRALRGDGVVVVRRRSRPGHVSSPVRTGGPLVRRGAGLWVPCDGVALLGLPGRHSRVAARGPAPRVRRATGRPRVGARRRNTRAACKPSGAAWHARVCEPW